MGIWGGSNKEKTYNVDNLNDEYRSYYRALASKNKYSSHFSIRSSCQRRLFCVGERLNEVKHQDSIAYLRVHVRTPRQRAWEPLCGCATRCTWPAATRATVCDPPACAAATRRPCRDSRQSERRHIGPRPTTRQVKPRRRLGL